jgi:hypothetical protein
VLQATEPVVLRLAEGRPGPFFGFQARPAPGNELLGTVGPVELREGDRAAEEITALILRRFYELFGFGREAIPHLVEDRARFDPGTLERT